MFVLIEEEVRWKREPIIVSVITSVPLRVAERIVAFFRVEHIVYSSRLFCCFFFSLPFYLLLFSFYTSTRFIGWLASDGLVLLCSGLVSIRVKEDSVICCVWRRRDQKRRLDSVHDSNEEVGELVHRASVIFLFPPRSHRDSLVKRVRPSNIHTASSWRWLRFKFHGPWAI